jgi:16S rRNA (guanine(527)-N(7))-methyltransferase RsmG
MGKNVNNHHLESNCTIQAWQRLMNKYALTPAQIHQLQRYLELLIAWNSKFNLTAITDPAAIIEYHFDDSHALAEHIDPSTITTTADIGTGAGFPGMPLKILFPHLHMILIEVNSKKRTFLEHVAQELGLDNITIYPLDWRTFLRTNGYKIDYFFARASLQPDELVRIFKPSCAYKEATLVYWASRHWVPSKCEAAFVEKEIVYKLESVERKFVFFKAKQH